MIAEKPPKPRHKGGRRRLVGGFSVWLPDHREHDGHVFRRFIRAAQEITGPMNGSERLRVEIHRYAVAGVVFERATRVWAALAAQRDRGRGRRPSERQVERAARRVGLAGITLREAAAQLGQIAAANTATRQPRSGPELAALAENGKVR